MWGFVSVPEFHRRSRGEQFLFVNSRFVKNRYLEHAVTSAYGDLLPKDVYPFVTLFLDLDPRHVDVNVHPTKAEVKFDDERGLYSFLKTVVRKSLATVDLTPQFGDGPSEASGDGPSMPAMPRAKAASFSWSGPADRADQGTPIFPRRDAPSGFGERGERRTDRSLFGTAGRQNDLPEGRERLAPGTLSARLYDADDAPQQQASGATETADGAVWQIGAAYLVRQLPAGVMIIDQNAAHERILYERARAAMHADRGASQQLLFPHTIDFGPADYSLLRQLLPDLQALGFDIELFSGRSVVVRGIPADIRAGRERSILEDLLQQYQSLVDTLQVRGREALAQSLARRNAVRRGTAMTEAEMRALIDQLFACEMPYACPSGRPTLITIPVEELDKRFRTAGP